MRNTWFQRPAFLRRNMRAGRLDSRDPSSLLFVDGLQDLHGNMGIMILHYL